MHQFWNYNPESWLDDNGLSVYEPVVDSRPRPAKLRGHPQNWLVNLTTASIFGVSLAVTSLPVHAESGGSTLSGTLSIAIRADLVQRDRLGQLFFDVRSGSVRAAAPDLLERAQQIANRAPAVPVDLNDWAACLARDVANARD